MVISIMCAKEKLLLVDAVRKAVTALLKVMCSSGG